VQQHRPLQQIKNKKNNQPVENKNKKQSTTRTKLKWIFHPAGEEMAKNGAVKTRVGSQVVTQKKTKSNN